ncbi:MAG: hypothetical protein HKN27_12725 [Silicimonas sp.]|nr:hypothetical protein [Silicimonas sp.]
MPCLRSLVIAALALTPTALFAQQSNCADRHHVVKKLANGYGEVFAGGGLQNSSRIFEVWFSEDKGTWTILMTRADGKTCIMASGTNWREGDTSIKVPEGIAG